MKTAAGLFATESPSKGQRQLAKGFTYQTIYDAHFMTIWKKLIIDFPDIRSSDVERFKDLWFQLYPKIREYHRWIWKQALKKDYVATIGDRYIYFYGAPERSGVYNLRIQGSAADLIDGAIGPVSRELHWGKGGKSPGEYLLFQVHDALLMEGPDPVRLCQVAQKHMSRPVEVTDMKGVKRTLPFPVDFKVSNTSWGHAKGCDTLEDVAQYAANNPPLAA